MNDQSKQNQSNRALKQAKNAKTQSPMESSAELTKATSQKQPKNASSEKPDVDPGIDFMKWSD